MPTDQETRAPGLSLEVPKRKSTWGSKCTGQEADVGGKGGQKPIMFSSGRSR